MLKYKGKHDCQLGVSVRDNFLRLPPNASFSTKCWYKIKEAITVHENRESRQFFRSHRNVLKEKKRHLHSEQFKYIVIHPFSKFIRCHQTVLVFLWLYALLMDPYLGSFCAESYVVNRSSRNQAIAFVQIFLNCVFLVDMLTRFFEGYIVERTREIVLSPKTAAWNYFSGYFVVDFSPLLSTIILSACPMASEYQILVWQLRYVRSVRIKSLVVQLEGVLKSIRIGENVRRIILLFLVTILILHWYTCLLSMIFSIRGIFQVTSNHSLAYEYTSSGYEQDYMQYFRAVVSHFFGAGRGVYPIKSHVEMTLLSLVLITGMIFYILIIGYILRLFIANNMSSTKFEQLVFDTNSFMAAKRIPKSIRQRVMNYYAYKYDNKLFHEKLILDSLSEHLRMEVLLYSRRRILEHVQMFKSLSKPAAGALMSVIQPEIFLAKDVIMQTEREPEDMYFILYGTCCFVMSPNKEVAHVEDGDIFGISNVVESGKIPVPFSVEAVEGTKVYSLSKQDANNCALRYPEIAVKLNKLYESRIRAMGQAIANIQLGGEHAGSNILAELNRQRILSRGVQRNRREGLTQFSAHREKNK